MKLYIAGPMTGLPEFNFPTFNHAAAVLRAMNFEVVNPAEVNPDVTMSWAECMRRDIPHLLSCDGVVCLPGCDRSKGATLELHIARALGMALYRFENNGIVTA